jgi:hypothetical protein
MALPESAKKKGRFGKIWVKNKLRLELDIQKPHEFIVSTFYIFKVAFFLNIGKHFVVVAFEGLKNA